MAAKKKKGGKSAEISRKARLAAEKKRIADAVKRSKAARKGWATRRKNTAKVTAKKNKKLIKVASKGLGKKAAKKVIKSLPHLDLEGKTQSELEEIIRQQQQQIEVLTMTEGWVHAMPQEYLKTDGSIALEPSRARHFGEQTELMLGWMRDARKISENSLDREVVRIADMTGFSVRELYTLFHSP